TAVKYQLPIKVVVIKNNTLGQIKWEQMVFLGNPEYGCELQPIDFAAVARACGGQGFTITDPGACGPTLDEALAIRGPVLIEAVVQAFKNAQNSELKTLVSGDQTKRDELGKRYGIQRTYAYEQYDECLSSGEIDAVYIALPNHLHRQYTERAARAGIHILCEK